MNLRVRTVHALSAMAAGEREGERKKLRTKKGMAKRKEKCNAGRGWPSTLTLNGGSLGTLDPPILLPTTGS